MNSFVARRFNGVRLHIRREFVNREFLTACCGETPPNNVEHIATSAQARVFAFDYRGRRYFHKTFHARNALESVKSIMRGSRARRCAKAHWLLARCGFNAPQIIAVGGGARNFIVMAAVANCIALSEFLHNAHNLDAENFWREKRQLLKTLGQVVGKMHAMKISHGDLLCGNIMLSGKPGGYKIYFIDNERTRRFIMLPARERLKNLAQLNRFAGGALNNVDRLRFFNNYLNANSKINKKQYARKVIARTASRERARQSRKLKVKRAQH